MTDGQPTREELFAAEVDEIRIALELVQAALADARERGVPTRSLLGALAGAMIQHFTVYGDESPQTCTAQMRAAFRLIEVGVATKRGAAQDETPRIHIVG